jgi:hypothetical protein
MDMKIFSKFKGRTDQGFLRGFFGISGCKMEDMTDGLQKLS